MYSEVFPSRLKKAREYNGLTQYEVAKTIQINQSTYANYEAGKREPSIEIIALLSRLFEVSSDWLIGLTSESGINAMSQVIREREQEKILKKLQREAELDKRVWG
ncbi:MAG: helix-turn-helix transcriptional regulator [Defluviitaleaceae bacterium]|nr:helix-turn-helix transcriptional regulator [Defluviitaleaceae bacterium]